MNDDTAFNYYYGDESELDTGHKGIGLIERIKQGQGRPIRIYVKRFSTRAILPKPIAPEPFLRLREIGSQEFRKTEVQISGFHKCRLRKFVRKLY